MERDDERQASRQADSGRWNHETSTTQPEERDRGYPWACTTPAGMYDPTSEARFSREAGA